MSIFGLVLLVAFVFTVWALFQSVSNHRKAKRIMAEKGVSYKHACNVLKAEYKRKATEKIQIKSKPSPTADCDIETGEVYDEAPRQYINNIEEWKSTLKSLWEGNELVQFTYKTRGKPKERRKVELHKVFEDHKGDIFFYGFCQLRQDDRHFNIAWIQTMILHKGKRHEVNDFLYDVLELRWN